VPPPLGHGRFRRFIERTRERIVLPEMLKNSAQRDLAPREGAPILHTFCSFVEILYVQNNLACYGLGMRQPAHGCNVRAKRLTHYFILTFLS
jgi:hypothetical protein